MVFDKWHLGVTFGFRAKAGFFSSEEAKEKARAIAASGTDWVVLVVTVFQDTYCSTSQFRHFTLTPNDSEVVEIINYLHSLGLKVQLRPMLETLDGCGRLQIWFPMDDENGNRIPGTSHTYAKKWFSSMTERSVFYAKLAEETKCEMFCLDSELDRIVHFNAEWKNVVRSVREVYSGCVTSCHTTHMRLIDYERVLSNKDHWFYDLDVLSLSCYHKAATHPDSTLEEMKENYKSQLERFRGIYELYQKPILFGECGCTSIKGGAMNAAGWECDESVYDEEEQANYLEAVLETFAPEPWWYGIYWWKWDEHVPRRNPHKGFIIEGKKACEIYKKWSGKNRSR